MKYSTNKTYAPPVAESVVLFTEQCMANVSNGNNQLNDMTIHGVLDELNGGN